MRGVTGQLGRQQRATRNSNAHPPLKHLLYLCAGCSSLRSTWPQVQGQLWVSGYAWCDFMSYFPELPPVLIRVLPDDRYQDALDQHMPTFLDEMFDGRRRLQAHGRQG